MALIPSQRLGPYEILAAIGAGGMGEVYRARDTRLQRDVALKILPAIFAADPARMARFEREAKVLASLNHPNIAAIHGLEESGSTRALVMELVEGPTLAERIAAGPVPVDEALPMMKQVAEALEYAHDHGVIHRDLKPANIKVKADGTVKVLDFGLAKALQDEQTEVDLRNSPTLSAVATMQGVILGTAGYMSPEQAKGKAVDRRADIWAFGVVLVELLTGKTLYVGETPAETLAAVMMKDPTLSALPASTPPAIHNLLRRCLDKDPRQRLQHIGEARIILADVLSGAAPAEPLAATSKSRERVAWAVATIAAAAGLVLAVGHFREPVEAKRVIKLSVLPPDKAVFNPRSIPALSPDGQRLVFVANLNGQNALWVRDLDSLAARPLPGTDGADHPFWSPDGRFIAFFAGGKLKKIEVAGGPALSLCDAEGNLQGGLGGSWGKNDIIVFSPLNNGPLFRVSAAGGNATPATELNQAASEISHRFPWFLPDGRHFLYMARSDDSERTAVYVGDLDSKNRRLVLAIASNAVYTPPGYLLFVRDRILMAQTFDADNIRTTGDPFPIAEQVESPSGGVFAQGQFSSSQNGVLAYVASGAAGLAQLVWFDRSGKVIAGSVSISAPSNSILWPAISPDGHAVIEDHFDAQTGLYDVWLHDLARGTASRLTFNSKTNRMPIWSPDGSHIAFHSNDGNLYQKATSGVAPDEPLDNDARNKRADDWSRDGRYIIEETQGDPKTEFDIWILPLFGDRKPFPYLQTQFAERHAKLSPNGHWLAYVSNETKRDEVYVQTFPTPGGKWQVSTNGGGYPVWSKDGKELFFISADRKLMAVEVKVDAVRGGPRFEAGVPKPLFDTRFLPTDNSWFDVSKDGRFLIPTIPEQEANTPMTVVVNWTAGLKK